MMLSRFLFLAVAALLVAQAERDDGLAGELTIEDEAPSQSTEETRDNFSRAWPRGDSYLEHQPERDKGLAGELAAGDVTPSQGESAKEATVALDVARAEHDEGLAGELTTGDEPPSERESAEEATAAAPDASAGAAHAEGGEAFAEEGGAVLQRGLVEVNRHGAVLKKRKGIREVLCDQISWFVKSVKDNLTCVTTVRDTIGTPAMAGGLVDYGLDAGGGETAVVSLLRSIPGFDDALVGKTIWSLIWNGAKLWQTVVCDDKTMSTCKATHSVIKVGLAFMAIAGMFSLITVPFAAAVPAAFFSWLMTHGLTDLCDYMHKGYEQHGWAGVWKHAVEMIRKAGEKVEDQIEDLLALLKQPKEMLKEVTRIVSEFFQMMFSCLQNLWGFLKRIAVKFHEKLGSAAKAVKDVGVKAATAAGKGAKAGAKAGATVVKKGAEAAIGAGAKAVESVKKVAKGITGKTKKTEAEGN